MNTGMSYVIMLLHLCKTCIERSGCYVCGEHLITTLQYFFVLSTGIHLSRGISDCALQVKAIRDEELHISYDIVYCCMQVVWCSMIMDATMKVEHG